MLMNVKEKVEPQETLQITNLAHPGLPPDCGCSKGRNDGSTKWLTTSLPHKGLALAYCDPSQRSGPQKKGKE